MNNETHPEPEPISFDPTARDLGVLVGVDGSKGSFLALYYGALAAQRSGRVLTVVTSSNPPVPVYTTLAAVPEKSDADAAIAAAETVLTEARDYLRGYPGKVVYRSEHGDAAGVLVDLSTQAELAVVGARGRGGFVGRILGSVASALPAHGRCPTVVVPMQYKGSEADGAPWRTVGMDQRPVVVGIDGSAHSRVAMLQAAQFAQIHGVKLRLVMVLPGLKAWLDWYPELDSPDQSVTDRRKAQLMEILKTERVWVKKHFPSANVVAVVVPGDPVAELVKQTQEAQLTVVGTRGRSGFTGALMGSVSQGVLLRASGPVMVVPDLRHSPGTWKNFLPAAIPGARSQLAVPKGGNNPHAEDLFDRTGSA